MSQCWIMRMGILLVQMHTLFSCHSFGSTAASFDIYAVYSFFKILLYSIKELGFIILQLFNKAFHEELL